MEEKKKTIKKTPIKKNEKVEGSSAVNKTEENTELKEFNDMKALLADMKAELDLLKNKKSSSDERIIINNVKEDKTDVIKYYDDDYLEVPAVFFAYSLHFFLSSDTRRGKISYLKDKKPAVFHPHYRYVKSTGGRRGQETVSISRLVTHSKTEAEWLRNHSLYGIRFFENIKATIDQDTLVAEKMVAISNQLGYYNDMQLINRAAQEGLNITNPDISKVRQKLIHHLAKKELQADSRMKKDKAKNVGLVEERKIGQAAASGDTGTDVY